MIIKAEVFSGRSTIFYQSAGQKAAIFTFITAKGYKIVFYQLNAQIALKENNVFLKKLTVAQRIHSSV